MKHVKILGLAVVVVGAAMAFLGAGTVSATVLCSTTTTPCNSVYPVGSKLDWSLEPGSTLLLKETSAPGGEGKTLDTCKKSTITEELTSKGSATTTVQGSISKLTLEECTFPTAAVAGFLGGLEVHSISGTSNGTVTSNAETRVTFNTVLFGSCVFGFRAGIDLGTLTEGNPSTFDFNVVAEKLTGSAFACPATGIWSGSFVQTADPTLTTLAVEPS